MKLSEELFQFVGERDKEDPALTQWIADASEAELNEFSQRSSQYMNETMHLYDQRYAGRVMSLFEALEQRGSWSPEKLSSDERKRIQDPGTPYDKRDIARRLSTIGHRLGSGSGQSGSAAHRAADGQPEVETESPQEKPTNEESQPDDEDLKRRCRELADDIRQFLEDHQSKDKEEIMRLYRRGLGDRVSALLEELEEHGMYPPENLKSFEISANAYPRSPMAIERVARTLGTIGHRQ